MDKELERIIKLSGIGLSVDKVIDIAKTIISIDIKTDGVKRTARRTLFLTEEQKIIQPLFDLEKLVHNFGWRIDEVRSMDPIREGQRGETVSGSYVFRHRRVAHITYHPSGVNC